MMQFGLPQYAPVYWAGSFIALAILSAVGYCFYNIVLHPLRKIPGPLLASLSPFRQIWALHGGQQHIDHIKLHEKYGPVVRVSPDTVLINDSTYFAAWSNWDKADWWLAFRADPVHLGHNSYHEVKEHSHRKKLIMTGYQMSAVLKKESTMDKHVLMLATQLQKRTGKSFDLAPVIHYAAFDIVMDMVFSRPLGFLASASDVDNVIEALHSLLIVANTMALLPSISKIMLTPWLFKYVAPKPTDKTGPGRIHGLAYEIVRQRYKDLQKSTTKHDDILQSIIDKNNPDSEDGPLPWPVLEQESIAPILAGSDSVAGHIRAAIFFLSTNNAARARLRTEIDAADAKGALSEVPRFHEVKEHIPYMDLIMKETMRAYPVVGSPLPRAAPKDGAMINGHFIPPGTQVAISQWAVSRNRAIFGKDVEVFRPERWETTLTGGPHEVQDVLSELEANANTNSRCMPTGISSDAEAKIRLRDSGYIPFSLGPMMCTGRNIATVEIYKIVTQLFRLFEFEIGDPAAPWKSFNKVAMVQWDFFVKVSERKDRPSTVGLAESA